MALVVSPTQSDTTKALRSFLLAIIPTVAFEVVLAQVNRVPEPKVKDYAAMTPMMRARLETNIDTFIDTVQPIPALGSNTVMQATQLTIQLDVYGPNSADNVQIISTLFRDPIATDFFDLNSPEISPLFASDPRQLPFNDGEQQVENRWSIDLQLQVNETVTGLPQDFATTVGVLLINVDATYPS